MSESAGGDRRQFMMGLAAIGVSVAGASGAARAQSSGAADKVAAGNATQLPTFLVVYRAGPRWLVGKPLAEQPLKEHSRYMLELYRRGVLRLAGPFKDGSGGAVLFEADSDASAQALVQADPAVSSQVFSYELHQWGLVAWEERSKRMPP